MTREALRILKFAIRHPEDWHGVGVSKAAHRAVVWLAKRDLVELRLGAMLTEHHYRLARNPQ